MSAHETVRERRFDADQQYDGWRLDAFLAVRIPRLSRSRAARIIRGGGVHIEPERGGVKPATVVRDGDTVVVRQSYRHEADQYDEVRVLGEVPGQFVAIDKPAGMLVHPTATVFRNTIVQWARTRGGYDDPCVVHRLDRETSGVMLLGLASEPAGQLARVFFDGGVRKRYLAVAHDPDEVFEVGTAGCIDIALGFDASSALPTIMMGRGDLSARTHWQARLRRGPRVLVDITIEGGRQHQIRAHLALAGAAIVGDKLYRHGAEFYRSWLDGHADGARLEAPRQALHAFELELAHEGVDYRFRAAVPGMFAELLGLEAVDASMW